MNIQTVVAQVHIPHNQQSTIDDPNMDNSSANNVEGTWVTWDGSSNTSNDTISQHSRFQRSDAQAMTDLFLMKLDEEERQEEMIRHAVENPIRTVSAYNAFLTRRGKTPLVTTSIKTVEASQQSIFKVPNLTKNIKNI